MVIDAFLVTGTLMCHDVSTILRHESKGGPLLCEPAE